MTMLTINEIFARHKSQYPDSYLSLHSIRRAVNSGELKSISTGSKRLINWDVFNNWLGYEGHLIEKLMEDFDTDRELSDKEKNILIKLLIEKMERGEK